MNAFKLSEIELKAGRAPDCLEIEVPAFCRGPYPPAEDARFSLFPIGEEDWDLPVYVMEQTLREIIQDEVHFRRQHGDDWYERCWFPVGSISRDPDGNLWSMVHRFVRARNLDATPAFFAFGPDTWAVLRNEIIETGEELLGWIHTHSVKFLLSKAWKEACREPSVNETHAGQLNPSGADFSEHASGLFLSTTDIQSALDAAHQITCILDSDACLKSESDDLSEVIGVWGWHEGYLKRRSIHVVWSQEKEKTRNKNG